MSAYAPSLFQYVRRRTREVKVGDVGVGGKNPIRVQSMTISDTMDTEKVVRETLGLVNVGCEIVRITAPTIHHAENLKNIRERLRQEGITVPLVADIHFTPQAAMIAAEYVEKVRINPGNFADRKLFAVKEYSDAEYESELQRMADKFLPLVRKCKARGVAMRIGTNHGSLSDRIMNRYGDTPLGMVESALEFVRLCESEGYRELIISMKASSPFIMIQAYRMLAEKMAELGMDYPFHLGVTEAGEGEDGRIKSAIGIGSLLEDGIGDTIRVSLTEDSVYEIPVAEQLAKKFNTVAQIPKKVPSPRRGEGQGEGSQGPESITIYWNPLDRSRRKSEHILSNGLLLGGPYAISSIAHLPLRGDGREALQEIQNWLRTKKSDDPVCDLLYLDPAPGFTGDPSGLRKDLLKIFPAWKIGLVTEQGAAAQGALGAFDAVLLKIMGNTSADFLATLAASAKKAQKILQLQFPSLQRLGEYLPALKGLSPVLISLETRQPIYDFRRLACAFHRDAIHHPLSLSVDSRVFEEPILEAASALGSLLMDGIGDALEIRNLPVSEATRIEFNILQASRLRISKAEFIACPSCGRTLFDLQETTQRIKTKTGHLKGVKIAIMGCIVNGPGEMADADFGYVGGGPGRIHLYVGKECVEKNIPTEIADQKLIDLIKRNGRWVDPADEDPKKCANRNY